MIAVMVCGSLLRGLVRLFGIEIFSIAFACSIAQPCLDKLQEYLQEQPL